jgi:hypothetical protein
MPIPVQTVFPGMLAKDWHEQMHRFAEEHTVERLWNQDSSLWPVEEHELPAVKSNLCWLNLPDQIGPYLSKAIESAHALQKDGLDHVVFVSMGGSNLAGAAVLDLRDASASQQMFLLDTTDSAAIRDAEAKLPLEKTVFVFSNKSGKRLETHCLLLYFLDKFKAAGTEFPGKHFIALTEPGSYLASLAGDYRFRDVFFDPPGIIGRYSGLIHFSLFLTAVLKVEPARLLETITAIRDACRAAVALEENPSAALAALLAAGERRGLNRLILLTAPELFHFAYRIAQLTGASTSSAGRGFVAIFGQRGYALETIREKCLVVKLRLQGQTDEEAKESKELRDAGVPMVEIELKHPVHLAAEIFKWEVATTLAGVAMGLNPFRNGNTQGNFGISVRPPENVAQERMLPGTKPRVTQDSVSLYADGRTRRMISNLSLRDALRTFLQLRNQDSYIAILPFFKLIPAYIDILQDLRDHMRHGLGMPVQVSSGPRYIYALGTMYKQGPANGIFIVVTAEPREDMAIPGADYTFRELNLALAVTDCEALENSGKPAIRLHLAQGAEKGLKELRDVVIQPMAQITRSVG